MTHTEMQTGLQTKTTAEAVSGRATGVLFFAGFGSLWLATGLSAMHRLNPVGIVAIATIFTALAVPAVILLRSAKSTAPSEVDIEATAEKNRAFNRINTMQWIAIVAAGIALNLIQKQEFLVPVITFIVGMHLFPLATLFNYRAHNVTGTLLVAWATGVVAMLHGSQLPSTGAVGTAVILLGSAAYTLVNAYRSANATQPTCYVADLCRIWGSDSKRT